MARLSIILLMFVLGVAGNVMAALVSVSGKPAVGTTGPLTEVTAAGPNANVAINLANGYPLWYKDANNLKLALCLDNSVQLVANGPLVNPCLTAEPFPANPIVFPGNFGPEAFYWSAVAFGTFTSSTGGGNALLVLAHEAAFGNALGVINEGDQTVFGRVRVRITVPVAGTYRVTHPFGSRDFVVPTVTAGAERSINQTQDVGLIVFDFVAPLNDAAVPPTPPAPADPSISALPNGIVNTTGLSIGPFLTAAAPAPPFITAVNGERYLSDPGTDALPNTVHLVGAPFTDPDELQPANWLRITLLNPQPGFFLNAVNGTQVIKLEDFQVVGKLFDDSANLAPVAAADSRATKVGQSVLIDVVANDSDLRGSGNSHGLNSQAIGLVSGANLLRTQPLATAGGTVERFTSLATGKSTLKYTPNPGFVGLDTFQYVVQDTGGLISQPTTVSVTVEDLKVTRAEYRLKHGKWRIEGTSSNTLPHGINIMSEPRAYLTGNSEVPPVSSSGRAMASLAVADTRIDFRLTTDELPASTVTRAHIHVGSPGANGPVIFSLYDDRDGFPFSQSLSGTLTAANLQPASAQGINNFADAVAAILAGNAYVNIHSANNPGGEIRGQLIRSIIGSAQVGTNGKWEFVGKSRVSPVGIKSLGVEADNGVAVRAVPLAVK